VKPIPENEYWILNGGEKNQAIISTYHILERPLQRRGKAVGKNPQARLNAHCSNIHSKELTVLMQQTLTYMYLHREYPSYNRYD
jgi:hypothetical protein